MTATRRTIITQAAGVLAVTSLPARAAPIADPAFALIDAHRKAEARYYDYPGEPEEPEFDQLGDETEELAWDLAKIQPTTLKGVAALARYASTDNADQQRWPDEPEWRCTLLASIAAALERIAKA